MKINITNFESLLKKTSVNHLTEITRLIFSNDHIISSSSGVNRDIATNFKLPNDVLIDGDGQEVILNLIETKEIVPFIKALDEPEAEAKFKFTEEYPNVVEEVYLKTRCRSVRLFGCDHSIAEQFLCRGEPTEIDYFYGMDVDKNFIQLHKDLKPVAKRFGKYYFNVENNLFSMETTDKTNIFAKSVKFDLAELENMVDRTICFDAKNLNTLISFISNRPYKMWFSWSEEVEKGMIYVHSNDETEKLFLMSRGI